MRHLAIFLISIYQKTLSPDHGFFRVFFPYGFCRYYPSCSEYMRQSIFKYGFFIGIFRGLIRLLRCNPWTRG